MQLGPVSDTRRSSVRADKIECRRSRLSTRTQKFRGRENRLKRWRRPEPQAGAKDLLRESGYLGNFSEGWNEDSRKQHECLRGDAIVRRKRISPTCERKMLQL